MPEQPWPATPLCTLQVTFVFVVPVIVAKNCRVEAAPPDGARNAYTGEIVTATVSCTPETVISALALLLLSAWLVAVTATGFAVGAVGGAR